MKSFKESPIRTRRKFDPTFKREAVQNWLATAKSAEVVAQELASPSLPAPRSPTSSGSLTSEDRFDFLDAATADSNASGRLADEKNCR